MNEINKKNKQETAANFLKSLPESYIVQTMHKELSKKGYVSLCSVCLNYGIPATPTTTKYLKQICDKYGFKRIARNRKTKQILKLKATPDINQPSKLLENQTLIDISDSVPTVFGNRQSDIYANYEVWCQPANFTSQTLKPSKQVSLPDDKPKQSTPQKFISFNKIIKRKERHYLGAIELVVKEQRGSTSLLQRVFGIGYGRAARIIDYMYEDGIVGKFNGGLSREVLISSQQWEAIAQESIGKVVAN